MVLEKYKCYAPKKRSKLRIFLGTRYYRFERYLKWYMKRSQFASKRKDTLLPCVIASHHSPLLRQLKDVDMKLQYNKIENLRIALERCNGIIIEPGQSFSYWRSIGKPTKRKGYLPGMILYYGHYRPGIGGGLCQLSNLLYWIFLHTELTITERYRHSYDVFPDSCRTQPFGSGATCVFNYRDLVVRNDTDQVLQLHLWMDEMNLYGEVRSVTPSRYHFRVYEKKHWFSREVWGQYMRHNEIYRCVYDKDGTLLNDEFITENHALMMYEPLLTDHQQGSQKAL